MGQDTEGKKETLLEAFREALDLPRAPRKKFILPGVGTSLITDSGIDLVNIPTQIHINLTDEDYERIAEEVLKRIGGKDASGHGT